MRPYQIAATERILWKIKSSHHAKTWSKPESGGYIWHTTGSGKTLTSFKAARLATELEFIDKVFFVVDRKDLDYQTMKEYQRFSPDSVNGSENTAALKRNLAKDDNKIVVTTIQKLNNLMKSESDLSVYGKEVVFIFDECHRSQFGEAQRNLKKKFKRFYQFGFTGTPIFPGNASGAETTAGVFGQQLHSYVITDAIRDEKVLKFKVDYNDVRPKFRAIEREQDQDKLNAVENRKALLHPQRIREVSQYILNNFRQKTHRSNLGGGGFNAMFAVSSVEAAKLYYEALNDLQDGSEKPLKIATIFSFAANEEQNAIGEIRDESFDVSALESSGKEFLNAAIRDYNTLFATNFSTDGNGFQNYYRDLANRVKSKEVDLLIVVGMFLTGFDAPSLNTLFVDKNLRFHGLIQAYSRTNRIFDATKTFGNIVAFRDLEKATIDAITLFGDSNTKNVVLEKSFQEYMEGFTDIASGRACRGFLTILDELEQRFPDPTEIFKESDKKDFAKLFGEFLRAENVLQNFDEFVALKAIQDLDQSDPEAVAAFSHEPTAGIIYVLTNDAMPGMIKIGRTSGEGVERRVAELSRATGVPLPFKVAIARSVYDAHKVEKALHTAFGPDRVNPSREFFAIAEHRAVALINAFPGEDLTPQTERAVEREVEAAEPGTMAAVRTFEKKRRPPLNFEEMGVALGAILVHVASGETVEVIEAKKVLLRGEIVSLTKAQRIVSGAPYAVQPGRHWLYNGTSISDLYEATYPHETGDD